MRTLHSEMESTNPNFAHAGTLQHAAETVNIDEAAEYERIAEWGRHIENEPRSEVSQSRSQLLLHGSSPGSHTTFGENNAAVVRQGKLIDTIGAARQRHDCEVVLACLRAGLSRVLVVRAGLDAVWGLAIGRDLHPPDRKGHGQLHMVSIAAYVSSGVLV